MGCDLCLALSHSCLALRRKCFRSGRVSLNVGLPFYVFPFSSVAV